MKPKRPQSDPKLLLKNTNLCLETGSMTKSSIVKIARKTNDKNILFMICSPPNRSEKDQTISLMRRSFSDVICGRILVDLDGQHAICGPDFCPWRFPCTPRAPNIVPKHSNDAQQAPQRFKSLPKRTNICSRKK